MKICINKKCKNKCEKHFINQQKEKNLYSDKDFFKECEKCIEDDIDKHIPRND